MLLEQAGIEVGLFEARNRLGGRLHTVQIGDDLRYEAGGEWIDSDHFRILGLMKEFGISPLPNQEWPGKVVHKFRKVSEAMLWNDALEDDLRVEAAAREIAKDLEEPAWKNHHRAGLDQNTVADFLNDYTTCERGHWWVNSKVRSDEGEDLNHLSLLGWLYSYRNYLGRDGDEMSSFRVPCGFQTLCERMASTLDAKPNLNKVLYKVSQGPQGVTLHFEDGEETFDRVVLTLPPRPLERIMFEPSLTYPIRSAMEANGMGRSIKICWQFKTHWWREDGWGGNMHCDSSIQQTWDGSLGDTPILSAYVNGDAAARWAELGDPVRAGLYELSQIEPVASDQFVRGWFHNWVQDPYAMGGFSHLPSGFVMDHLEHVSTPHLRVHFAGEHTARWQGFIEGAFESAERVATEILAAEA